MSSTTASMIHWHEGLFLLPQHFQALQRQIEDSVAAERGLLQRFPSGVLDLELDIHKESVAVRRLSAIMPSGIRLEYPHNVDIPSRHIGAELLSGKEFQVSLGLPLRTEHGANVASNAEGAADQSAYLYKIAEAQLSDDAAGGEKKPVLARKYNARLVLDSDDRSNLELLPLVRIRVQGASGLPQLNTKFCPPLLRLRGWQPLYLMVSDLARDLELGRDDLRSRMLEGGFDMERLHGNQLAMVLRLRALQSALPRLRALVEAPQASPFETFIELGTLLGDLCSQYPTEEAPVVEGFRPDDIHRQFETLITRIRARIQTGPVSSFLTIEMDLDAEGNHRADFTKEFVENKKQFYLCVDSSETRDRVIGLVTDVARFKLTTPALVNRPRNGLRLSQCPVPPGAPARQDSHYFRIEHRDDAGPWAAVEKEYRLAAAWPRTERISIEKLTLYAF